MPDIKVVNNDTVSKEHLRKGQRGEIAAMVYLDNLENVQKYQDVRKEKEYQKNDVDFVVKDSNDIITNLEAKTDNRLNGTKNYIVEIERNYNGNTETYKGWFLRSTANVLTIFDTQNEELHIFDFKLFKDRYEELVLSKDVRNININTDDYDSLCVLMPINKFEDIVQKIKITLPKFDWQPQKLVNKEEF